MTAAFTPAFTPELAVQYLAELEPGLEAVAVVSADGTVLAGEPSLAASAEVLMTARSARHGVLARVGAGALDALVRHDLEMVARELG